MEGNQKQSQGIARVTVELLHPITHDGQTFSRGQHELETELAELFLSFRDPIARTPIARLPQAEATRTIGSISLERGRSEG